MNTSRAFLAGVTGGIVMSIIMALARAVMGMEVHLEATLGSMFLEPGSAVTWVVGLLMHLMISGLIALAYAWAFENVLHRADWMAGLGVGVIHTVIAGLFMGYVLPAMHPLVPEQMAGPGPFMANLGTMGIVAFVMLHLIFGAIVGTMYHRVTTRAASAHA